VSARAHRRSPRGAGASALVIALASLGLVLAAAEWASRTLLPAVEPYGELVRDFGMTYPAVHSDYLTFTLPPSAVLDGVFGHVETNALGYRGPSPATVEKPAGTRRVLVLGDSFVFGWGVPEEDSIPGQLRARLANPAAPVEIVNAGYHAGAGPDAYYAYLRREGMALAPDVVVLVVFTSNDIDDVGETRWLETDAIGGPTRVQSIRLYGDWHGRLLNPEILPWNYQVRGLRESRLWLASTGLVNRLVRGTIEPGRVAPPAPIGDSIDRFLKALFAADAICREHGVGLLYVALPPVAVGCADDALCESLRKLAVDDLQRPYVSLHGRLDQRHQIGVDPHLNREGNGVVVDAVLPDVRRLLDARRVSPSTCGPRAPYERLSRARGRGPCGAPSGACGAA
jgi:hypothetical protein